jgi:hypothetical protein
VVADEDDPLELALVGEDAERLAERAARVGVEAVGLVDDERPDRRAGAARDEAAQADREGERDAHPLAAREERQGRSPTSSRTIRSSASTTPLPSFFARWARSSSVTPGRSSAEQLVRVRAELGQDDSMIRAGIPVGPNVVTSDVDLSIDAVELLPLAGELVAPADVRLGLRDARARPRGSRARASRSRRRRVRARRARSPLRAQRIRLGALRLELVEPRLEHRAALADPGEVVGDRGDRGLSRSIVARAPAIASARAATDVTCVSSLCARARSVRARSRARAGASRGEGSPRRPG